MNPTEWFTQAMDDARVSWYEGVTTMEEFETDCVEIAVQYVRMVTNPQEH